MLPSKETAEKELEIAGQLNCRQGIPASRGIFFVHSRHVETVVR
ncbi:hypothetical protein [Clostridium sp.]